MEYELMGCDYYQDNNKSKMFSCGNPIYFFDLYITHEIPIKTKITWNLHCEYCKFVQRSTIVVFFHPNLCQHQKEFPKKKPTFVQQYLRHNHQPEFHFDQKISIQTSIHIFQCL